MILGLKGNSPQHGLNGKCSHRLKNLYIWSLVGSAVGEAVESSRSLRSAGSISLGMSFEGL